MSNHGYSRRRPKSKGPIVAPTARTHRDTVTGEIERVNLDAVQKAFEAARRAYENAAVWHGMKTQAECERLADMMLVYVIQTKRHRDRDVAALRELLATMGKEAA